METISLSNTQVEKFIKNVIQYEELKDYSTKNILDELPIIILYQMTENSGHWTLLHRVGDQIEFFDSYGLIVDKEFDYLPLQQEHYLAKLLYKIMHKYKQKVSYNHHCFQSHKKEIATCGRHCILRNLCSNCDIDTYYKMIKEKSAELDVSMDTYVCLCIDI